MNKPDPRELRQQRLMDFVDSELPGTVTAIRLVVLREIEQVIEAAEQSRSARDVRLKLHGSSDLRHGMEVIADACEEHVSDWENVGYEPGEAINFVRGTANLARRLLGRESDDG